MQLVLLQEKIKNKQKLKKVAKKEKPVQEKRKTVIVAGKFGCKIKWINLQLMQ